VNMTFMSPQGYMPFIGLTEEAYAAQNNSSSEGGTMGALEDSLSGLMDGQTAALGKLENEFSGAMNGKVSNMFKQQKEAEVAANKKIMKDIKGADVSQLFQGDASGKGAAAKSYKPAAKPKKTFKENMDQFGRDVKKFIEDTKAKWFPELVAKEKEEKAKKIAAENKGSVYDKDSGNVYF